MFHAKEKMGYSVAIDGPAGAGKSTIAKKIATVPVHRFGQKRFRGSVNLLMAAFISIVIYKESVSFKI